MTSRRLRASATRIVVGDFEGYLHWLDPTTAISSRASTRPAIGFAPRRLSIGDNVYVQGDDGTVAAFTVRTDAA